MAVTPRKQMHLPTTQLLNLTGHFDGPKPVLLTDTSKDDLSILLCGSNPAHSQIEFGAHQAVLVRSQAAKKRLPAELERALVLTIFESKGLEFDDVFIFDFFADSPADARTWRVVTACHEEELARNGQAGRVVSGGSSVVGGAVGVEGEAAPRAEHFDARKHSLLNEELKMLYTAVTRARVKVVIYDRHREKRAPMFHFLLRKGLAEPFNSSSAGA